MTVDAVPMRVAPRFGVGYALSGVVRPSPAPPGPPEEKEFAHWLRRNRAVSLSFDLLRLRIQNRTTGEVRLDGLRAIAERAPASAGTLIWCEPRSELPSEVDFGFLPDTSDAPGRYTIELSGTSAGTPFTQVVSDHGDAFTVTAAPRYATDAHGNQRIPEADAYAVVYRGVVDDDGGGRWDREER